MLFFTLSCLLEIWQPYMYTDQNNSINVVSTNQEARGLIRSERWKFGFKCPRCLCLRGYPIRSRDQIECAKCGKQTSPTANTIYHGTRKPLLDLVLLDTLSKKSDLSTRSLSLDLQLHYSTAWHHAYVARFILSQREPKTTDIDWDGLRPLLFKRCKEVNGHFKGRTTELRAKF